MLIRLKIPRVDLESASDTNSAVRIAVIEAGGNPEIGEIVWYLDPTGDFYNITWRNA